MKIAYSILLLVFSIIIIAELAGIYILYEFKNSLEDQIMKDSEKINIMMINRIDSYATERLVDLINLSKSGAFETDIQASNMQFSKMVNPEQYVDEMDSAWTSVPMNETTPFMKTLIDSQSSEQLRQILNSENTLFQGEVYGEIFMTNQYGANVLESDKTSDYKQSDESWWQEARKNGIYVGGAEFDASSGTSSFAVASRLNDENGNFIGVAKGVVNIQQIINIIRNQMNITSSVSPIEYELVTGDGKIIVSTDPTEKPFAQSQEPEYNGQMNNTFGHFAYTKDDNTYLVTYSHSQSSKISPLFNWIFITKYKSTEVLAPVNQITDSMLLIIFILIITTSVAVFTISKKLVAPIEKINEGISSFSKGNQVEIKLDGMSEFHDIAEHFNHMTKVVSNSNEMISKSEEKFRIMFELSPVPIILTDENYAIKMINKKGMEAFEYKYDEIVGKPIPIIISDRSMKEFTEYQSMSDDITINKKAWLVKKDKKEFPCLINTQKIHDQNKKIVGNIVVIKDITELENIIEERDAEGREAKKLKNLYKGLFELSPDPIRVSTLERTTVEVNQSFLKKFGYTNDEIVGKSIYENIDEDSRKDIEKTFDSLRQGKNVENVQITYRKKDGTKIPSLLSVSQFYDQSNNPIGYIAIIKDISEINRLNEHIKNFGEEALNQYLKIKQIEELKEQFASMASHELITPLFPIKFQTEMLKDPKILGKLNKEQTNSVNEIYQNALLLERLIEDMLDVQKLEMGKMSFVKKNIEMKSFIDHIVDSSKNLNVHKEIEFENSIKAPITITTDPDRLTQVFFNLIKNSVDFVPEKTGKIEIGAKMQENDILFYVKDNGIGITKSDQANLFKKFYQTDTSITRKHRGSGLGLSICKGIVEGLGGKIWLESTEGLGTIVYFTVPKGDKN